MDTLNTRCDATASSKRFVKVAAPTVNAGVGDALRAAFAANGERRSLVIFEELLARLDKPNAPS